MSWARSSALGALPLVASLAAVPATSALAAEPRPTVEAGAASHAPAPSSTPSLDLDHLTQRGGHWVAPTAGGGDAELTLDPDLQQAALKNLASANPVRGAM